MNSRSSTSESPSPDLANKGLTSRIVEVFPGQVLRCNPPADLDSTAGESRLFFGRSKHEFNPDYQFAPSTLAALPYSRLVGDGYVVVSHDNHVIEESYSGDQVLHSSGHFLKRTMGIDLDGNQHKLPFILFRNRTEPRLIEQPCVLPTHYWHFNYHHWLIECLPRFG